MGWQDSFNASPFSVPGKFMGQYFSNLGRVGKERLWQNPKARALQKYKELANDPTDPYSKLKADTALLIGLGGAGYGMYSLGKGMLGGLMGSSSPLPTESTTTPWSGVVPESKVPSNPFGSGVGSTIKPRVSNPSGWGSKLFKLLRMTKKSSLDIIPGYSPGMVGNDYFESKGIWNNDSSGSASPYDRFRAMPTPRTPRLNYEQMQSLSNQNDISKSLYLKSK